MKTNWSLLAAVRFGLAAIVVSTHMQGVFGDHTSATILSPFSAAAAVFGFLMISGYSIANSFTKQPKGYWERRFWRIYPSYLACLILALVPWIWCKEGVITPPSQPAVMMPAFHQFIASVFLLQTFVTAPMACFASSWSLAIEEWLYLPVPLLKKCPDWAINSIIVISGCCHLFLTNPGFSRPGMALAQCAWAWLLGWQLYQQRDSLAWRNIIIIVPALLVGHTNGPNPYGSALVVAVALALIYSERVPVKYPAVAEYLGNLSYPIYLVHLPVILWVYYFRPTAGLSLYVPVILLASMSVYHLVDKPLRKRGRKQSSERTSDRVTAPDEGAVIAVPA